MKLFVWNDVIGVSYGGSCLYVVAEDEEQARSIAATAKLSKYGHDPRENAGFHKELGKPTRVIEAPCAEVYFWQE